jgi:hypothetical protein
MITKESFIKYEEMELEIENFLLDKCEEIEKRTNIRDELKKNYLYYLRSNDTIYVFFREWRNVTTDGDTDTYGYEIRI